MKETYFIAISLTEKPFVSFMSVGSFTPAEFAASIYATNGLVVKESELPAQAFGVCSKKIVGGNLVDRDPAELLVLRDEYDVYLSLKSEPAKIFDINKATFTYDDYQFPMDEVSRLFYLSLATMTPLPAIVEIKKMDATKYTLGAEFVPGFLNVYYTRLYEVSKHTFE